MMWYPINVYVCRGPNYWGAALTAEAAYKQYRKQGGRESRHSPHLKMHKLPKGTTEIGIGEVWGELRATGTDGPLLEVVYTRGKGWRE